MSITVIYTTDLEHPRFGLSLRGSGRWWRAGRKPSPLLLYLDHLTLDAPLPFFDLAPPHGYFYGGQVPFPLWSRYLFGSDLDAFDLQAFHEGAPKQLHGINGFDDRPAPRLNGDFLYARVEEGEAPFIRSVFDAKRCMDTASNNRCSPLRSRPYTQPCRRV